METTEQYLKRIYYDSKNPASFSGLGKFYNYVKRNRKDISKSSVFKWLRKQEAYSLHRQTFKPQRTPIVVAGIDDQWIADLMDMTKFQDQNDNVKYLLVVIDTFSKYLWIRPLSSKTGASVAEAFRSIFAEGRKPQRIRSDKGQEFRAKVVQALMTSNGVKQLFSQNETKTAVAERVIKTVKSKIFRFMTYKNSQRYVDDIQDFARSYNETKHKSTMQRPIDVNQNNEEEVRIASYLSQPKTMRKKQAFKFKLGDKVRITYLRNKFSREYDHKWTGEVFTVSNRYRRLGIPVYRLQDNDGEELTGTFYNNELLLTGLDDDQLFKIEKIVKTRGRGAGKEYFVKWLYWPTKFNSWIKASDVEQL